MKQKELEIYLNRINKFQSPSLNLEQYQTPDSIAASLCHMAYMNGDIYNKCVLDLGCGTGILALGSSLLGAISVYGVDIDKKAIDLANKNAAIFNKNICFICSDISHIDSKIFNKVDTILMNPPFGSSTKGADRPFLLKALDMANTIYTIHNKGSYEFIKKYIYPSTIVNAFICKFPIYRTFSFHKKDVKYLDVEIYKIKK